MKKILSMFLCLIMVVSLLPTSSFASTNELMNPYYKVGTDEFLAMADENGLIHLDKDLYLTETVVIDDGKDYTLNFDAHYLVAYEGNGNTAFQVKNGTLNFINEMTIDDEEMSGVIEDYDLNLDYIVTVEGDNSKFTCKDVVGLFANKASVLVKGGAFEYDGDHSDKHNGHQLFIAKEDTKIVLKDGSFLSDIGKYVSSDYTVAVSMSSEDELMYSPYLKPSTDDEAVTDGLCVKGSNGYYYRTENAAKAAGVAYKTLAYPTEIIFVNENDQCNYYSDFYYFNAKVGSTYAEAYKAATGEDLKERTEATGHFAGWKKIADLNNYIEWGEMDFEGEELYYGMTIYGYSNERVDINAKITEPSTIVAKWCKETKTTVSGKVEATYGAAGYTGDTVCKKCGLVLEKGDTIPALVKVEQGKAEVTESVLEDVIKEATANGDKEVVIPLADTKENVNSIELPVKSVETIVDSGKSLVVETKTVTVTLDNKALSTVIEKAEGEAISLQVEEVNVKTLNEKQKEAVKDINLDMVISAEIICSKTGDIISEDFGDGKATISVPFNVDEGEKLSDYTVIYIADDGSIQIVPTKVVDGKLVFEIDHFSEYAVVKTSEVKGLIPSTGDVTNLLSWAGLMIIGAVGTITFKRKKEVM